MEDDHNADDEFLHAWDYMRCEVYDFIRQKQQQANVRQNGKDDFLRTS